MTAMSLIVQAKRRAAYLISDCAWTDRAGRLTHISGKIIQMARFPAAIGVQGNVSLPALGAEIHRVDSRNIARLVQILPDCLRRAIAATYEIHPETPAGTVTAMLKVAAWSARLAKPVGYVLTSDPALATAMGGTDWTVHGSTSSLSAAECPTVLFPTLTACEDPAQFDPLEQAFDLVAHERRTPQLVMSPGADVGANYRIGGSAQVTEVTKRGVKVWGVGSFPDMVGLPIDPSWPEPQ